jgi:hypothetical protein
MDGSHARSLSPRTLLAASSTSLALVLALLIAAPGAIAAPDLGASGAVEQVGVKVSEQGRELIVHLTGPSKRKVLVTYTATYRGKKIDSGQRTVELVAGKQTAKFELSARVAAYASIEVTAKFAKG